LQCCYLYVLFLKVRGKDVCKKIDDEVVRKPKPKLRDYGEPVN
jgi:hypothetical protein